MNIVSDSESEVQNSPGSKSVSESTSEAPKNLVSVSESALDTDSDMSPYPFISAQER